MSMNWQNLRSLNNSQNAAFEELCCQLAAYEPTPNGSKFIRKGAPDAGVECFWKLPNGNEWGWQAKYFLSAPGETQWSQLDESVKAALKKHPHLTVYTVCLPIDRQDPRIDDQNWFMDKWHDHVKKWESWAADREMEAKFEYWGAHEIWERLSREEHRGRHFFWFNKEFFSDVWFKNRVEEAVEVAGPRYTPELDVELPVARLFDGLGRTSEFHKRIKAQYGKIKKAYSRIRVRNQDQQTKESLDLLRESVEQLLKAITAIDETNVNPIDWEGITHFASKSRDAARKCIDSLNEAEEKAREAAKNGDEETQREAERKRYEQFEYARSDIWRLKSEVWELEEFTQSHEAQLSNLSALLLVGDAGKGKTHLFCDVATKRVSAGLPTVLLLGEWFTQEEPWTQIVRLLGLGSSTTREDFLGALEAAAQASGSKAFILIDALNEGEGKKVWRKHIAAMLKIISRYPWISVAISVRTSYEDLVIPEGLVPDKLVRAVHRGFAEHEYQATRTFFDHFGIEHPSVPLLIPEFQTPLFLKVFCQGLHNENMSRIPAGLRGITAIFQFFVESVNKKLSRPEYLNYNPKRRVVWQVVDKLAAEMASKHREWLPLEEAQTIANSFLPYSGYEDSLFRHLVSEGILTENRLRLDNDEWCEVVHFAYERFSDHLIIRHLLDRHLDIDAPSQPVLPDQPLAHLIEDELACWRNRGLVEALAIQLPERTGKELPEIVPTIAGYRVISEAFIESLIWRDTRAITEATRSYINEYVVRSQHTHDLFLNALLTVAINPDHPYNADFLHKHLMRFEMAGRDAWWSIFLHERYGTHEAVDRLIDWAWAPEEKSHISDEAIRLCGVVLAWFLTTSNRFLRDRATKALVNLFTERIHVLRQVIRQFLDVNDPYVSERMFAVAYGCAMRSVDDEAIGALAQDVYNWVFQDGEPPPHILLRDYARGVVEVALCREIELDIDVDKIGPPYRSEWPTVIPTEEEIEEYDKWEEDMPDEEWGRVAICSSVMGFGDFARYVIGTNSGIGSRHWLSHRIDEPPRPTRREMYHSFVDSLTERQKKAWDRYNITRSNVRLYRTMDRIMDQSEKLETFGQEFSDEELEEAILSAEEALRKTLGKRKLQQLDDHVLPYLNNPHEEDRFDLSIAQRWIVKKVFDLGWTVERFGTFDRYVNWRDFREAHKAERIGKKYQWIAYHEFLARLSDNFQFSEEYSEHSQRHHYNGPWQISIRDIDPSCLLKKTESGSHWDSHSPVWWFPTQYDSWESKHDDVRWMQEVEDLPDIKSLIEIVHPQDHSCWLVLDAFHKWEQPTPLEQERYDIPTREIWYLLRSYIVHKSDMDELYEWAVEQDFMGRWMPETHELYDVFLGEYFWSPAFDYYNDPYARIAGWTGGDPDSRVPKQVLVSAYRYVQEDRGFDCSIDEGVGIRLPNQLIVNGMGLSWDGIEGHFFDRAGKLIALDPSVKEAGPSVVLINRDAYLKFLDENGYDILWTVLGEKQIIGGSMSRDNWKGRLELSGAYRICDRKIEGVVTPRFRSPKS